VETEDKEEEEEAEEEAEEADEVVEEAVGMPLDFWSATCLSELLRFNMVAN
jgi:hypothetical protein